jgi:hypothetical protein
MANPVHWASLICGKKDDDYRERSHGITGSVGPLAQCRVADTAAPNKSASAAKSSVHWYTVLLPKWIVMPLRRPLVAPKDFVSAETIRRDRLRLALPATVAMLRERHADQIDVDDIEAYVALNWLEWQGGGLRLTITGKNVCAQMAPAAVAD